MIKRGSLDLSQTGAVASGAVEQEKQSVAVMSPGSGMAGLSISHEPSQGHVRVHERTVNQVFKKKLDELLDLDKGFLRKSGKRKTAKMAIAFEAFLVNDCLGNTNQGDKVFILYAHDKFECFLNFYPGENFGTLTYMKKLVFEYDNDQLIEEFGVDFRGLSNELKMMRANIIRLVIFDVLRLDIKQGVAGIASEEEQPDLRMEIVKKHLQHCFEGLKACLFIGDKTDTAEFVRHGMLVIYLLSINLMKDIVPMDRNDEIKAVIFGYFDDLLASDVARHLLTENVRDFGCIFACFIGMYDARGVKLPISEEERIYGLLKKIADWKLDEESHSLDDVFKECMVKYSMYRESYTDAFDFLIKNMDVNSATDIVKWYSHILILMNSVDCKVIRDVSLIRLIMEIQCESVVIDPVYVDAIIESAKAEKMKRSSDAQKYLDEQKQIIETSGKSDIDKSTLLFDAERSAQAIQNLDKSLTMNRPPENIKDTLRPGQRISYVARRLSQYLALKFYTSALPPFTQGDDPHVASGVSHAQPISSSGSVESLPGKSLKKGEERIVRKADIAVDLVSRNTTLHLFGEGVYCLFQKREEEAVTYFQELIERFEQEKKKEKGKRGNYPCFDPSLKLCRLLISLCYERQGAQEAGGAEKKKYKKALDFLGTEKVLECGDKVTALARMYLEIENKEDIVNFLKKYPNPPNGNTTLWEALELTVRTSASRFDRLKKEVNSVLTTAEFDKDFAVKTAVSFLSEVKDAFDENKSFLKKKEYDRFVQLAEEGSELQQSMKKKKAKKKAKKKVSKEEHKKALQSMDTTKGGAVQSEEAVEVIPHESGREAEIIEKQEKAALTQADHWVSSHTYREQVIIVEQHIREISADLDYASFWENFDIAFGMINAIGRGYGEDQLPLLQLLKLQEKTYQRSRVIAGSNIAYFCGKYDVKKEREAILDKKQRLAGEWLQNAKVELSRILKLIEVKLPDDFIKNVAGLYLYNDDRNELKDPLLAAYLHKSRPLRTRFAGVVAAIGHLVAEGERITRHRGPSEADGFFRLANQINPNRWYRKIGCHFLMRPELVEPQGAEAIPGLSQGI